MIANGIGFPNEIITALENDRLVVFAGAGVSYDAPTSLPDFEGLTNRIVSETGLKVDENRTDYEAILGDVEVKLEHDVNKMVATLLDDNCKEPNKTHEAIVNLFRKAESVRIVTTNYDLMIEKALKKQGWVVNRYSAPALPLGDDFTGIVHVHGAVDDSKYMVLTDKDFGIAYITEGYSARFLTRLFMNYTVLFVGYSYNDTIVKYLTRAIAQKNSGKLFVLTDKSETKWHLMGVEPIRYNAGEHARMQEALVEIGTFVKRPLTDWRSWFNFISETPPTDPTDDSEISFCLNDIVKARLLAECVGGPKWTEYLVRKGVFTKWFDSDYQLSQIDEIWVDWLTNKSSQQYDAVTDLLGWYSGRELNTTIAGRILDQLSVSKIDNQEFITLLDVFGINCLNALQSAQVILAAHRRGLHKEAFDIFVGMFEPVFFIERFEEQGGKENVISWRYRWSKEDAAYVWGELSEGEYGEHPEEFLQSIISCFCNIQKKCCNLLEKNKQKKLELSLVDIEEANRRWDDPIITLAHAFTFFATINSYEDPEQLARIIEECVESPFIVFRRAALIFIRESNVISLQNKCKAFVKGISWDHFSGRKQIYLLGQKIICQLGEQQQNELVVAIKKEYNYSDGEDIPKEVYEWVEWLHRTEKNNANINRLVELGEAKNYMPQTHPEDLISVELIRTESPLKKHEMKQMMVPELVQYITGYKRKTKSDFSEVELHEEFIRYVSDAESEWIIELVRWYFQTQLDDKVFVGHMLTGISNSHISGESLWDIVNILVDNSERVGDYTEIASLFLKAVQDDTTMNSPKKFEKDFWRIAEHVRASSEGKIEQDNSSLWNTVCNNPAGLIVISAVWMLSYQVGDEGIERFFTFFNRMLTDAVNRELVVSVLSGQLDLFWQLNKSWCTNTIIPWLQGNCKEDFQAAWIGVDNAGVYWGSKIGKDILDVFLSAFSKLNEWGDEEINNAVAGRVAQSLILTPDLYEDINIKMIPQLYRSVGEKGRERFVGRLGGLLKKVKEDLKRILWEKWIGKFYKNRFDSLPMKANQRELEELIEWLVILGDIYEEAASIIIQSSIEVDSWFGFWYKWAHSEVVKDYPVITMKLLERLLPRAEKPIVNQCVTRIRDLIRGNLNADEKRRLDEILIKNGLYSETKS